jgi:hypothetical protein
MQFKKADKKASKLRCSIFGPSGAGKTYTSLRIANGFKNSLNGKIAFIDSERGSASKYADRFDFDVLELERKTISDYIQAIKLAGENNYNILIIDSLSHAWQELIEDIDKLANIKYKGNTWRAWAEGTPKQRSLIDAIINYPGHVIATIRSKTEWEVGEDKKVRRVGLSPEQGKGIEYEFDMLLEITVDHYATVIKDRTGKYQDKIIQMPDEKFGSELIDWLNSGSIVEINKPEPTKSEPIKPLAKEPIKPSLEETFSKYKLAISESIAQFDISRFIKANGTFQKYIDKLPQEIFEEYEHFINSMFSRICDAIEAGSITVTQDQEKELIAINNNWKLQIQTSILNGKKSKDEEAIF